MCEATEPDRGDAIARLAEPYEQIHRKLGDILQASVGSPSASRLGEAHQQVADIESWIGALQGRLEVSVLKDALCQCQHGLQFVVCGQYRYAFICLRCFLEQALRAVWLSGNEVDLRHWLNGSRDVAWAAIVKTEGPDVFCHDFVRAFFPALCEEAQHMRALALKAYREASEFVHGNTDPIVPLPADLSFSERVFNVWHDTMSTVMLIATFALTMRYARDFGREDLVPLERPILDQLNHIEAVRGLYADGAEGELEDD